jgi:hypothetical protein
LLDKIINDGPGQFDGLLLIERFMSANMRPGAGPTGNDSTIAIASILDIVDLRSSPP